jgi:hypothetical protein
LKQPLPCPKQTAYPATLHDLNSFYPDHAVTATTHFIALREPRDAFQQVTPLQFIGLDPSAQECSLQLQLPDERYMGTGGTNPVLEIWQVKADETGSPGYGGAVKWRDFVLAENTTTEIAAKKSNGNGTGNSNNFCSSHSSLAATKLNQNQSEATTPHPTPTPLAVIPRNPDSLSKIRANGGIIVIDNAACNQTLTFQVGIQKPGAEESKVSYWNFINVAPPASPVQGWRVVLAKTGC